MFKEMKKRIKNEKGLTLIELLAVIVILAIIAAIAIPAIGNIIDNSRASAIKSDGINVLNSANIYFTDNPVAADGTVAVSALKSGGYLDTSGTIPDTATVMYKANAENQLTATGKKGSITITFSGATVSSINASAKPTNGALTINSTIATPAP